MTKAGPNQSQQAEVLQISYVAAGARELGATYRLLTSTVARNCIGVEQVKLTPVLDTGFTCYIIMPAPPKMFYNVALGLGRLCVPEP